MEGPADVRRRAGQEVEPFGTDCVRCVRDICLYLRAIGSHRSILGRGGV